MRFSLKLIIVCAVLLVSRSAAQFSGGSPVVPITAVPITASQITDFKVTATPTTATVSCGTCSYRIGAKVMLLTGNKAATSLTGTGAPSTVFFYLDGVGNVIVGVDGTGVTGAVVSGALVLESFITSFPADSIPLAACSVLANAFTGCTDYRAIFGQTVADADNGALLIVDPSSGKLLYRVNPAVVGFLGGPNLWSNQNSWTGNVDLSTALSLTLPPDVGRRVSVPASASTPCVAGQFASSSTFHYDCIATDSWVRSTAATW